VPYQHTTFQQLTNSLAGRLGDPNKVFWTQSELEVYVRDALRQWSLLTQYTKKREEFTTTPGQPFYNLNDLYLGRGYTATDTEVIVAVQHHLMEPAPGTSWTGTEQFSYDDVLQALARRRNRLLLETGCVLTDLEIDTDSPPVGDLVLPDTVIDVRRAAWRTPEGVYRNLRQQDTSTTRSYTPRWSYNAGTALSYIRSSEPHVSIRFAPPSIDAGRVRLILAHAKPSLNGQGNLLEIPDDAVPTLKWGVIADLLSSEDGPGSELAKYAEDRWMEGVEMLKQASAIWTCEINGVPVNTTPLVSLDSYQPNWHNTLGHPKVIGVAGLELIALAPVPDGQYSVLMDITEKMPVPVANGDFIQVGRELLNTILDYCVHLASFKQQGEMFSSTIPLLNSFYKMASRYNSRLSAQAPFLEAIKEQNYEEQRLRPREEAAAKS
jgi:hypothetical protein